MPGKLPGGKVRISQSAPSIIKKTKNPATSEVQYFGLVRDLYLEDLTSSRDALEQVLEDVQDPAERKAEGAMKIGDLTIIDGIVDSNVKKEDLEILAGASLSDAEGGTLVNPRFRLADRIAQYATFAGRGIEFAGAGPVKFTYLAPLSGDLLPGTVQITTAGVVTGSGTTFDDETGLSADARLNRTLAVGDFVSLYEADGETLHRTGATSAAKKADTAIYKVTAVASNTQITLSPVPGNVVTAGKKLRKRYSHTNPPPFFKESIASDVFNSSDAYPTTANYTESHRLGFLVGGQFQPQKDFESWWEGKYNHEMRDPSEYGSVTDNSETNPKYPIVKDGNLSFDVSRELLPQKSNFGFRFDFWMRRDFDNDTFAKFKAQVNGHLKIDFFDQTGYSGGSATGTWRNALDTTNSDTFFRQISKEGPATNRLGYREIFIQGGPDLRSNTSVSAQSPNNSLDLSATYTDEEGNSKSKFDNNYVPVTVRYWFGQDTIDNSTTPEPEAELKVEGFEPSFALNIDSLNLPSGSLEHYNSYFGFLKLQWVAADSQWSVLSTGLGANYDANASKLAHQFEVVAYTAIGATEPTATAESSRTLASLGASIIDFGNVPDLPQIADRYDDGSTISDSKLDLTIPGVSPADGDVIYIIGQNRPNNIVPSKVTAPIATYGRSSKALFASLLFNPDPVGKYKDIKDMLNGGANFIEPNPRRNEFEDNAEYFKYKYGVKPGLNTYGPARYDGFIKNRVSTTAGDYDSDYTHTKILPIGRQQKGTSSTESTTGNTVPNPKTLSTDVTPTETRAAGENYTFISVEEDEAGNGGEIVLMGYPISTLAAIAGSAGQGDGGRILHENDNSYTFSNADRQNIDDIQIENIPSAAQFDTDGTFSPGAKGYSIKYASLNGGAVKLLYPAEYTTNPGAAEAYDATTQGMISSLGLGVTQVIAGTNGRTKSTKSIFIASFNKQIYGSDTTRDDFEVRYFIDFLLGTRPNSEKEVTTSGISGSTGEIADADLFGNLGGSLNNENGNRLYNGALIEFYADSDALANSGAQVSGEDAPVAQAYVTGYDASTTTVDYSVVSGTPPSAGNHSVRVYYNYFEITEAPTKATDAAGNITSIALSGNADGSTMQIGFVYNASYGLSKADTGSGLSFAESLFVAPTTSTTNLSLSPFNSQTELPSPPSVTVTPFGFDNQPTTPGNPGLGGLCYPPYQTQDIDLKETVAIDSVLYAATEGEYDVYFGSPQVSLTNLGNKFLQVSSEFSFDFSEEDRPRIIPEGTELTSNHTLPTFDGNSYTHKLKVNLSPYIGNPTDETGLFTVRGNGDYTDVPNDNIFKDALVHSNNKPVKETFYLFAKKSSGTGEQPISILTDNNPGYT